VQPHRESSGADTGQLPVHPGLCVVESPAGGQRQPLRQSPHRRLVGESNTAALQAVSVVHPHRIRRGHQHVGGVVGA
jgi:hypothetical protein